MADDLAAMKARLKRELARGNALETAISEAITTAIKAYQTERFRFSSVPLSVPATFNTVANQAVYTKDDLPAIGSLMKIDSVFVTIGNTIQDLRRGITTDLLLYNNSGTMKGQPDSYAYDGTELLLSAIPSDVWPITLRLFKEVAAPANDGEVGNPWMTDAEALIRSRAKYEIALHVTRNAEMAADMSPLPPGENGGKVGASYREWRTLKGEANRAVSRKGRIRPMRF